MAIDWEKLPDELNVKVSRDFLERFSFATIPGGHPVTVTKVEGPDSEGFYTPWFTTDYSLPALVTATNEKGK